MQQQSAAMQDQRGADERRHEENTTALKTLIAGFERQPAAPETVAERTTPADGARTKGHLTPFPAGETSKSSDCRGRTGCKSRYRCRRSRPTAVPTTTSLAGAKLDLPGDLFSVSRARLAADGS